MLKQEEAIQRGEEAINRSFKESAVGYYSGSSFVLASAQVFQWFASIDAMLEHIVTVDPVIFDVPEDECATIRQQLAPVFERIQAAGPSVSALQQINEVLSDYQCISWWGTPDDLMRGNSKFALQLRAEFRDGGQSTPIEASELDAFACFLSEYGV